MITLDDVLLTVDAKKNFMRAIIRIAKSDGKICEKEKEYVRGTVDSLGLPCSIKEELEKCWNDDNISVEFETLKEKIFTIMQIVQLAWIDGEYAIDEQAEVRRLATDLGISANTIDSVEAWVREGMQWVKRGEALLELE